MDHPRLTWPSLDRGERRRLKLTRQNGMGNVASTCAESCFPPQIGDAGGSEILAVSKPGYVVILRRRTYDIRAL
jgi:hypothetical protein